MATTTKARESGLELFRILTMFVIVCHHYVVHSGISAFATSGQVGFLREILLLIYGGGGRRASTALSSSRAILCAALKSPCASF